MKIAGCLFLGMLASVGCRKDPVEPAATEPEHFEPRLDASLLPALAQSWVLGVTGEAEVAAVLDGAERKADRSLAGDQVVMFNGARAIVLTTDAATVWLTADASGMPRLSVMEIQAPGVCETIGSRLKAVPEARSCPGSNVRTGHHKAGWLYCAGTPDGKRSVSVECRGDRVSYTLRDL